MLYRKITFVQQKKKQRDNLTALNDFADFEISTLTFIWYADFKPNKKYEIYDNQLRIHL